jgi:glycosyltransferase involved in cell wall biosynthesis
MIDMPSPTSSAGRPIRILHVVENFGVGGLEQVIKTLALCSSPLIKPHICVLRWTGAFLEDLDRRDIPWWKLQAPPDGFRRIVRDLGSVVAGADIDIIHCHDLKSWFHASFVARRTKTKLLVTRHGSFDRRTLKQVALVQLASLSTDRVIAVSPDIASDLVARYHIPDRKVGVIVNGLPPPPDTLPHPGAAKLRLGLDPDSFVLGTVTRFYPVKNIPLQLELVEALRSRIPNLVYVVAAPIEGKHFQEIDAIIDAKKLRSHVRLLGFRPDIPEVLSAFDVFIMTSHTEGTSIALLEAMQAGLPAVVSNVGGNVHIISSGQNGYLFDLDQFDALKDIVMKLYADPSLRQRIGEAAVETARKYGAASMATRYQEEYFRILQGIHHENQ